METIRTKPEKEILLGIADFLGVKISSQDLEASLGEDAFLMLPVHNVSLSDAYLVIAYCGKQMSILNNLNHFSGVRLFSGKIRERFERYSLAPVYKSSIQLFDQLCTDILNLPDKHSTNLHQLLVDTVIQVNRLFVERAQQIRRQLSERKYPNLSLIHI